MDLRNRNIIIFGLGTAALFLLRKLHNVTKNIYCLYRNDDIGRLSKYGNKFRGENPDQLHSVITQICGKVDEKPIGIFTAEYYLSILNDNPETFSRIDILGPDIPTYQLLTDKSSVYEYGLKIGIDSPRTMKLNATFAENNFRYPGLVKWSSAQFQHYKRMAETKTLLIESQDDYFNICETLTESEKQHMIMQEYLPSEQYTQYSYGGYLENNKEILCIVVEQIRQYPTGVSSYVREVTDRKIVNVIRDRVLSLIHDLKYTGFLEVEFRVNKNGNGCYLLDVNPRTWGWISILGKKYPKFSDAFCSDEPSVPPTDRPVKWANIFHEFSFQISTIRSRRSLSSLRNFLDYRVAGMKYDVLSLSDIKPFFGILLKAKTRL